MTRAQLPVRLRRDWRALLTHGYGTTFITMPIFLIGSFFEAISGRTFDLFYASMLTCGLLQAVALGTGRTLLTEEMLLSGSIFRRRSYQSKTIFSVDAGRTQSAFGYAYITLRTAEGMRPLPLSYGLGEQRQADWANEIERWLEVNGATDAPPELPDLRKSNSRATLPQALMGLFTGAVIAATGELVVGIVLAGAGIGLLGYAVLLDKRRPRSR